MNKRTILITGATSGIGKATADVLARQEAHLVLACRNEEKMNAVIEELKAASGNRSIEGVKLDMAVLDSVRECAGELNKRLGRIDVLINNAGVFSLKRGETTGGFENTFCTNYLSHFLFTHLLLPLILKGQKTENCECRFGFSFLWADKIRRPQLCPAEIQRV